MEFITFSTMFPPNTIIIIFIALAVASLQLASPFYILNYTSFNCNTSIDLFAGNSNYSSDLDTLLSALSANLSTGFTNYTAGSVYGLALCRGDVPSSDCTGCISTAVAFLRFHCPFKKEAVVWREWCTVRYSNRYIFSTLEVDPRVIWRNVNGASGRAWTEALDATLRNVTESAGGDANKFATVYMSLRKMYAMAQCTPDLTEADCKECFRVAVGSLVVTQQGSFALLPSCMVRYELYPFYFNGTDTTLQPLLTSPSPSPAPVPLPSPSPAPVPLPSPSPSLAEYRLHPYLGGKRNSKMILYSACSGSIAFILLVLVIIICSQRGKIQASNFLSRDNFTRDNRNVENVLKSYASLTPKRYTYSDIKKMTRSFAEKLGEGGFGGVYKGKLLDGRLVAVKLLKASKGNGEGFINEVASIGRTNHVNVVSLLGFCFEGNKRALVYEYISNGSLEKFIHDGHSTLPLETLFRVVLGVARGLEYLHRGCQTRILHFDIKPHNILLDEEFRPKISDFGLAKLAPRDKQSKVSMSGARGTVGYIAPEVFCRSFGDVSHKSDVYSYGMMVLEVIGSRKRANAHQVENSSEQYFPHWIYKQLEHEDEGEVDIDDNDKELKRKMIVVSLWCIQPVPSSRPSMSRVVQMLEGSLESIEVPPMPLHSSPPRIQWAPSTSSTMSPGVSISPDSNH